MIFMKKIEQWGRSCIAFGSRYKWLIIIALSSLMVVFGVFYGVVYGRLWLKFPDKIKAGIALNRLGASSYNYPICHEACFYERQLYKQIIAGNLNKVKISDQVKRLILAEDNNLVFRLELLDVLSSQPIPDYLNEYLVSGEESKVQEKIKELFVVESISAVELMNRFLVSSSPEDQIDILNLLQKKSDSTLADFYLGIIINNPDLKIKNGALAALSNLLPSEIYVTDDFLSEIKDLIFASGTDKYLRKEIILLLGEYLPVQENIVTEILTAAYLDETAVDKFSRLFVVDILNRSSANNYTPPEISTSEWQEYRDHNSLWGND